MHNESRSSQKVHIVFASFALYVCFLLKLENEPGKGFRKGFSKGIPMPITWVFSKKTNINGVNRSLKNTNLREVCKKKRVVRKGADTLFF